MWFWYIKLSDFLDATSHVKRSFFSEFHDWACVGRIALCPQLWHQQKRWFELGYEYWTLNWSRSISSQFHLFRKSRTLFITETLSQRLTHLSVSFFTNWEVFILSFTATVFCVKCVIKPKRKHDFDQSLVLVINKNTCEFFFRYVSDLRNLLWTSDKCSLLGIRSTQGRTWLEKNIRFLDELFPSSTVRRSFSVQVGPA